MDRQQEFVLRTIEDRDVRFVRLWFTDVVGTLKSIALAPAEVEAAFEEGLRLHTPSPVIGRTATREVTLGDAVIARGGAISENLLSSTLGLVFAGGTYGITNGSPTYPRPLAPDRELYGLSPRRKFGISSICGFELELELLPDELDEL